MRPIPTWLWSVLRHNVSLLGGATITVAMLIWAQYATSTHLPARIWWAGLVAGFLGSCYLSWLDEWTRANTLAVKRPEYGHKQAGIEQLPRPDGSLSDRYQAKFTFDNMGGVPADDFTSRVIAIRDFGAPPEDTGLQTMANRASGTVTIRTDVHIVPGMPPHYFALYLVYKDARTRMTYDQTMFYFWSGTGARQFDMSFRDCLVGERASVERYLLERRIVLDRM